MKAVAATTSPALTTHPREPKKNTVLFYFQPYQHKHIPQKPRDVSLETSHKLKERYGGALLHQDESKCQLGLGSKKGKYLTRTDTGQQAYSTRISQENEGHHLNCLITPTS